MRCFFCLEERDPSDEHVFPLAVGGKLITTRVCRDCNSTLGNSVDTQLINHPLITIKRELFQLVGNSGTVPSFVKHLKEGSLADEPTQRIKLVEDKATGKIVPRVLHSVTEAPINEREVMVTVTIDGRDGINPDQIAKIIRGQRKKAKMEPLSKDELDQKVAEVVAKGVKTKEGPTIKTSFDADLQGYKSALLKIAYELACLWLGDTYLDDPMAAQLRDVILDRVPGEASGIRGTMTLGTELAALSPWSSDKNGHIAFSLKTGNTVAIALRLFDIFYGVVPVTADGSRYVSDDGELKFIHMNPETGHMRQSSLLDEFARLSQFH